MENSASFGVCFEVNRGDFSVTSIFGHLPNILVLEYSLRPELSGPTKFVFGFSFGVF